jgi:Leucine rich repeat
MVLTAIVIFFDFFENVLANEVSCQIVKNHFWNYVGNELTCYMERTFVIDKDNFTVATHNESISGYSLSLNQNVTFLPIEVSQAFPNLIVYAADRCSIKNLTKSNFKCLRKLTSLSLTFNQIEKINSVTFQDLTSLRYLVLSKKDELY